MTSAPELKKSSRLKLDGLKSLETVMVAVCNDGRADNIRKVTGPFFRLRTRLHSWLVTIFKQSCKVTTEVLT